MQKKIIALAVAGLVSGAAFAQTNVTVYGVVDAYAVSGSAKGATKDSFDGINAGGLSGSRLGFKGTEDLGNGLKGVFVFEFGTLDTTANAATNAATQATVSNGMDTWRQSYVGLTGGFGTAVAGRLQNPGYDFAAKYDAHGASIFSPVGQLSDNAGLSITARGALGRLDNAIAYISPSFSGVTVKAAYAFGEQVEGQTQISTAGAVSATEVSEAQSVWALAADYDAGPLSVGFVYHDLNDIGGTLQGGAATDRSEWGLGAKYNFGMVTPFVSYQHSKTEVTGGVWTKDKLWNIGARVTVGAAGSVGIAYGNLKETVSAGTSDLKATSWGLDYQHSLSKRTTAYVGYSRISNDANMAYELKNLKGSAAGATVAADVDQTSSQIAVGVRHSF